VQWTGLDRLCERRSTTLSSQLSVHSWRHAHAARLDIALLPVALALAGLLAAVVAPDAAVELLCRLAAARVALHPEVVDVRPERFPVSRGQRQLVGAQLEQSAPPRCQLRGIVDDERHGGHAPAGWWWVRR
jgi:hypothetical protein